MRKFHGKFKTRPFNLSLALSLLSVSPKSLTPPLFTHIFIHSIPVSQWQTRSNYTLSVFGRFSEKPAFHFHFSVCVCECALCMPSNIQRDEKERQRTNCGIGCIRTYALYHRIMCSTILQFSFSFSFFLDFLLLLQLRLFSHVFRSI